MLEVVFSTSEYCVLNEAKFTNQSKIFAMPFLLDIGDISQPVASTYRQKLTVDLLSQNLPIHRQDLRKSIVEDYRKTVKSFQYLKQLIQSGETLRVWVSSAPYALCGLYYLCDELADYLEHLTLVKLPEYYMKGQTIYDLQYWSELLPEYCIAHLNNAEVISKVVIKHYQEIWQDLVEENAALRVNLNGHIIGGNEDFYDRLLWQYIQQKPVKQGNVIGKIIGNYPIGVSDYWYAKRIDDHIKNGKIQIIEDSEIKYGRTICLV